MLLTDGRYYKVRPDARIPAAMEVLYARAVERGLDARHGGVYDQIHREDGRAIKSTKGLWPLVLPLPPPPPPALVTRNQPAPLTRWSPRKKQKRLCTAAGRAHEG